MENADSAARAALAEQAVRTRMVRRLWALPGTRIGIVSHPASLSHRWSRQWHYWWQAHLLDCLVDAQLRDPQPSRARLARRLVRANLIRNGGRRTNDYYDDMAWWGLALQRAARAFDLPANERSILRSCRAGIRSDGVVPWRRGDVFVNVPANGPLAIMLARVGDLPDAARMVNWIADNLMLANGLVADGLVETPAGPQIDATVYTYCQGVVLGAELELMGPASAGRIAKLVQAVEQQLSDDGVLGGRGGGDGGLFGGILTRYLALVARRLPGDDRTRATAARLVRNSARAAWRNAIDPGDGLPVFGHDWSIPAALPNRNAWLPERDLSVQLSGWMVQEAAASLARAFERPQTPDASITRLSPGALQSR